MQEKKPESMDEGKLSYSNDKADAIAAVVFILLFVSGITYWLQTMPD